VRGLAWEGTSKADTGGRRTLNGGQSASLVASIEVADLLADDQGQLDLVMKVDALGLDNGTIAGQENGGWRLEEEEGLLGPLVVQLSYMVAWMISLEPSSFLHAKEIQRRAYA